MLKKPEKNQEIVYQAEGLARAVTEAEKASCL